MASFTYVPKYVWNDDERDTSHHISYHDNENVKEFEYIPSFKVMKEYFNEQKYTYGCFSELDSDTDSCNESYTESYQYSNEDLDIYSDTYDDFSIYEKHEVLSTDTANVNTGDDTSTEDGLNNNTTFNKYIYT